MLPLLLLLACTKPVVVDTCTTCTCVEEAMPSEGARHVPEPVDYADPPPTSGPHNPCWLETGVYDEEQPDERWVHSMEHGAVVYLYNCPEGCADEVATLAALAAEHPDRVIVSPYAALPTRFAAVAWQVRLMADCVEPDRLRTFYDAHVNRAPELVTSAPPSGCHEEEDTGADSGGEGG